ncbi:hypothetical protein [Paraburkholderia youngii]|uniref:hypothetical protein n=1 Tax=Paraburkholderia youngii TaxID=2782701 RepID=UPI003D1EF4A8
MEIRLDVISEEMAQREVAALSRELSDVLARRQDVESVKPVSGRAPDGAKGIGQVIGSFLVGLPVEAITGVLDIIKAIASRPGQPPFIIKITRDTTEISFDPRKITPDEVAKLAKRLRPPDK